MLEVMMKGMEIVGQAVNWVFATMNAHPVRFTLVVTFAYAVIYIVYKMHEYAKIDKEMERRGYNKAIEKIEKLEFINESDKIEEQLEKYN